MKLTKNISREELVCNCSTDCGYQSMDFETINIVQDACDHFAAILGVPKVVLIIHSAARCFSYNTHIGSDDNSQHPRCNAIDHHIEDVEPSELHEYYLKKYPNRLGLGLYNSFVHLDTRRGSARWVNL